MMRVVGVNIKNLVRQILKVIIKGIKNWKISGHNFNDINRGVYDDYVN